MFWRKKKAKEAARAAEDQQLDEAIEVAHDDLTIDLAERKRKLQAIRHGIRGKVMGMKDVGTNPGFRSPLLGKK
jgi:hypothetical protein